MNPPRLIHDLPVRTYPLRIADRALTLLGPADPDALLDDPDTERRFYAEDEFMPYWARPWPAAVMLAEFILARPPGAGRRAIEIGCGLGLAGLVAAAHGWRVTLTDYEPAALAFAQASAELNGISGVTCARLGWREAERLEPHDLILGADVLFEARWVEPIAGLIAGSVREGVAWISDPLRRTAEGFSAALQSRGMRVEVHPAGATDTDGGRVSGCIYEVQMADDSR